MPDVDSSPVSRRSLLSSASAIALALAGCSDVHSNAGGSASTGRTGAAAGTKARQGAQKGTLTFAFWGGSNNEVAAFNHVKAKFEAANPGARVNLRKVPYDGFFAGIDRGLQAGDAPDVFRVDYTNVARYASKGVLMDVSPYFSTAQMKAFLPALWSAVQYQGVPYGVPHQTDVTAVVYDKDALASAGVRTVPTTLDSAWTWEEFSVVAARLRSRLPATKFPFAYDWTKAGAYRWLSWLYQAGGHLLSDDLKRADLDDDAARKALDLTSSFFTRKWVPATNTVRASKFSDDLFLEKVVPMAFVGDFLLPRFTAAGTGYQDRWGVTFMPREKAAATDLGGNAVVANKDTKNADLAGAFLRFIVSEPMMKYFCEQATELPTLTSLANAKLDYAVRPDVVKLYAQQATTLTPRITNEVTVPAFNEINTVLQDQLESAFARGADTDQVLQGIRSGIDKALR